METISHEAMSRVVCRIFIKATPQAVWDAICPALKQSGGAVSPAGTGAASAATSPGDHATSARYLSGPITIGEILEADPPGRLVHALEAGGANSSVRSSLLSFELRDTLTGYTALTVSCEPAGAQGMPDSGAVRACDWDRLLGDLKTVLEADARGRRRTALTRPSPRGPLRLRPELVRQAQALSGGRLPHQLDRRERRLGARCECLCTPRRWRATANRGRCQASANRGRRPANANRGRRRTNTNAQPASAPSAATVTAIAATGGLVSAVSSMVLATMCRRAWSGD
jgi:hypothetical protein